MIRGEVSCWWVDNIPFEKCALCQRVGSSALRRSASVSISWAGTSNSFTSVVVHFEATLRERTVISLAATITLHHACRYGKTAHFREWCLYL